MGYYPTLKKKVNCIVSNNMDDYANISKPDAEQILEDATYMRK